MADLARFFKLNNYNYRCRVKVSNKLMQSGLRSPFSQIVLTTSHVTSKFHRDQAFFPIIDVGRSMVVNYHSVMRSRLNLSMHHSTFPLQADVPSPASLEIAENSEVLFVELV